MNGAVVFSILPPATPTYMDGRLWAQTTLDLFMLEFNNDPIHH